MKKVLMIGMGKFGRHLCDSMSKLGNELMVVDVREKVLEELVSKVMNVRIGDCTSEKFLKQVSPQYAVIMAGKDNRYSLPKANILERLNKANVTLYRTDEKGTIEMISDGNKIYASL